LHHHRAVPGHNMAAAALSPRILPPCRSFSRAFRPTFQGAPRCIWQGVRGMSSSRFMFLFPGQGAQQQGMAACLVKHSLAEVLFNRANEAAGHDVRSL
jgi:hypothetical protein